MKNLKVSSRLIWILSLVVASSASGADPTTVPAAADRSTPEAAIRVLVDAIEREDVEAIASGVRTDSEPRQAFARMYARAMIAQARYWNAAMRRWGRRECIEACIQRRVQLPKAYLDLSEVTWKIKGDLAVPDWRDVTPRMLEASPLRNINGQWLYDVFPRNDTREIENAVARAEANVAKIEALAGDIAAGRFASVHDLIDTLHPHSRNREPAAPPELTKEQLDPRTIKGAVMSLGQAYERKDARAAANFYYLDAPPEVSRLLAEAHAERFLAIQDLVMTVSEVLNEPRAGSVTSGFDLNDPRDDLFGHLVTEWTIVENRATGINDAGLAETTMRRIDDKWKIDLTPPPGSLPAIKVAEALRRQTRILNAVALAVRNRQLFTVDEVRAALQQKGLVTSTQPTTLEHEAID